MGNNVVIIHGEAQMNPNYLKPHPGYAKKYMNYLPQMNMTEETLAAEYSVEIIVKPTKLRG
jgi:hypothetical protein